jgi:hypothetical protein
MTSFESGPKIGSTELMSPVLTALSKPLPASSGEAKVVCEGFAISLLQPANITISASSINQEVKEILGAACDIPILQTFELSDSSTLSLTKVILSRRGATWFICGLPNHHHRLCSLHHEHWTPWTANRRRRY